MLSAVRALRKLEFSGEAPRGFAGISRAVFAGVFLSGFLAAAFIFLDFGLLAIYNPVSGHVHFVQRQLTHLPGFLDGYESTNITREKVVNHPRTQLNDALIASYAGDPGFSHKENGGLPGPPALSRNTDMSVNVVY